MWDDGSIWEGAANGELRLRACGHCAALCHPPLPMCPNCQSTSWTTRRCSGAGRVKSWFVSIHPGQVGQPSRLTVVVELAEGMVFVSNLLDVALDHVREGMPVQLCFEMVDGIVVPQFRPMIQAVG